MLHKYMMMQKLQIWTLFVTVLFGCTACSAQTIDQDPETPDGLQSYYPGNDRAVEVRIPTYNKGIGSTPNAVNVSFKIDELEKFLKIKRLKMSPELRKQLERDNCRGESDGSHFSLRISGFPVSDPLPVKRSVNNRIDTNQNYGYKRSAYNGLIADVYRDKDGTLSTTTNLMRSNKALPGIEMSCGYLYQPQEGGCTVNRDLLPRVYVNYRFCEAVLPHVKELDAIYMRIARAVIVRPNSSHPFPLTW